jgi:hypothetical protein
MKTLKISENLHKKVKIFCATNGIKMNDWVEKELLKTLKRYDNNEGIEDQDKSI